MNSLSTTSPFCVDSPPLNAIRPFDPASKSKLFSQSHSMNKCTINDENLDNNNFNQNGMEPMELTPSVAAGQAASSTSSPFSTTSNQSFTR